MSPIHHYLRRLRRPEWYSIRAVRDRKRNIIRLFVLLISLSFLHVAIMMAAEDLSFRDALWMTMTTITTVGYGDISPATDWGRAATVILLYLIGIFLLAQIAGEWIDFRIDRKERMFKGLWRWHMSDHIVIINAPHRDGARYLQTLIEQMRNTPVLSEAPIQLFSDEFPEGLPESLRRLGVVHHHGVPEGPDSLAEVDVQNARYIVILAVNPDEFRTDSLTFDVLSQLNDLGAEGYIIAECVQDENRDRFRAMGADSVIRPVRAYPELMVRALAAPGTEVILENLFSHQGVHPRRYNVGLHQQNWGDVAMGLLHAGLGTALGYVGQDGEVCTNPRADSEVSGSAIFLMVSHDAIPEIAQVESCIKGVADG